MRLALLFLFLGIATVQAQSTHYVVKLKPDLDHHLLLGEERIEFQHEIGNIEWKKQPGLQISRTTLPGGRVRVNPEDVNAQLRTNGKHQLAIQYLASPTRGIKWFANQAGFDTAFYCEAWMVCDDTPGQRATITLEIVLPVASGMRAVGPGQFRKQWRDREGQHFVFEQAKPVQTYLFSFGVAKLTRSADGQFILYAPDSGEHKIALRKTTQAYTFLRSKAGVDLGDRYYTQAVMPEPIEQEAAAVALMPGHFLADLEQKDDRMLMAHELAHQWWGVMVGIRSWSDFWLNEGFADFMMDAYLEHCKGRAAYDKEIAATRARLQDLREHGQDRPLHWEGWKDATGALGRIPYVKGALFLDRLRTELGEEKFWRGVGLYTSRNAGRLVDSRDFENAMEEASGRDLKSIFDTAVYH